MRRLLTVLSVLGMILVVLWMLDALLARTERQACGHEVREGGLRFWQVPHGCRAANMLAELNGIRSALRFFIEERGSLPDSFEEVIALEYLGERLFEVESWEFDLLRRSENLWITCRAEDGLIVTMNLDGDYSIEKDGSRVWQDNIEDWENMHWHP